jgi:hypothetical protein
MTVQSCDMRTAVLWLARNFDVPVLPKRAHLETAERWQPCYRAGTRDDGLNFLIKSGVYATLSPSEQAILPVLLAYKDENNESVISYRGIMRFSGVGSMSSVYKALKHFQDLHILERIGPARDKHLPVLRSVGHYRMTMDDADLETFAKETYENTQKEIAVERELRREYRRKLRQDARDKNHATTSVEITSAPEGRKVDILPVSLSTTTVAVSKMPLRSEEREIVQQDSGKSAHTNSTIPETESKGSGYLAGRP